MSQLPLLFHIREAFSSVQYPENDSISVETYDDEGTADYFRNTHWQDHELEKTSIPTSCLWFFTPDAFCYFLPAFMLASLRSNDFSTMCYGDLLAQLVPSPSDGDTTRVKGIIGKLTSDQRMAVLQFLGYCAEGDIQDSEYLNAIKALQNVT